jgi:hypothetical protein
MRSIRDIYNYSSGGKGFNDSSALEQGSRAKMQMFLLSNQLVNAFNIAQNLISDVNVKDRALEDVGIAYISRGYIENATNCLNCMNVESPIKTSLLNRIIRYQKNVVN